MTDRETVDFINELLTERGFSLEDAAYYYAKNGHPFKTPRDFFTRQNEEDLPKFYAIANLLSSQSRGVKSYFSEELVQQVRNFEISEPTDDDYLFVLTNFVYSPAFFSLAWNWVSFIEYMVKKNQAEPNYTIISISPEWSHLALKIAGSGGMQDMGVKIPLQDYGTLGFKYDVEHSGIKPYFIASDSAKDDKFNITVEFNVGNKNYSALIEKYKDDGTDEISAEPIYIDEKGDIEIVSVKVEF